MLTWRPDLFESWLLDSGYRMATVRKTVSAVNTVLVYYVRAEKLPTKLSKPTALALGKFLYFDGQRPNVSDPELLRLLRAAGVKPCPPQPMARKPTLERRSIGDADWQKLAALLRKRARGAPTRSYWRENVVLWLMVHTGLRIGETLGIEIAQVDIALKNGLLFLERKGGRRKAVPIAGAREPLKHLAAVFDRSYGRLCEWVAGDAKATSLAPDQAYQRVRRAFRQIGSEAGIDGRLNLHRIRRTVAVQALRLRRDTKAVQQLLGQESSKSTDHYLDELRELDVATLQQELRTFRETPP